MAVVINELEVVAAEPEAAEPAREAARGEERSPAVMEREVEQLLQTRWSRVERVRAY